MNAGPSREYQFHFTQWKLNIIHSIAIMLWHMKKTWEINRYCIFVFCCYCHDHLVKLVTKFKDD